MIKRYWTTALILISAMLQPLYAQDLDFTAVNINAPGLGNQSLIGAISRTGFLNAAVFEGRGLQPNLLSSFNVRDVAIADITADGIQDIAAVSADDVNGDGVPDFGLLLIFPGVGNGSFRLPQRIRTAGLPAALAVEDIDSDNVADVIVTEQGFVEIFTGFFINTGRMTAPDRIGNPNAAPPGRALITAPGGRVVAAAMGRLNGDNTPDIVIAQQGSSSGMFEVFLTAANGGGFNPAGTATIRKNTAGAIGMSGAAAVPAPRSIALLQSNIADSPSSSADSDLDIVIATSVGIEIFENAGTDFLSRTPLAAGVNPVGVIGADANGDGRIDLIALNRGSGTISTLLASASVSGYDAPLADAVGPNPVSLMPMNFNNDGRVDILVVNAPSAAFPRGDVKALASIGKGFFQSAASLNSDGKLSIFNPQSVITGRLNLSSASDDIVIAESAVSASPGGLLYLSSNQQQFNAVPIQIFTAVSAASDFDGLGGFNDVVLIEQNHGLVVMLMNVDFGVLQPQQVRIIEVTDVFTKSPLTPTSAVAFRDRLTGRNNLALTAISPGDRSPGSGQLIIFSNSVSGAASVRQFPATSGATNLMSGDFNIDGVDDLAYIDCFSNFVAVALNNGANAFLKSQFRETGGFVPVSAVAADVNDDDKLDVVVAHQGAAVDFNQSIVSVLLGQGDGRLVPTGSLLQAPNFALSIIGGNINGINGDRRIADFNGDGFPDFAVASTRGAGDGANIIPTITLLLNRPDSLGNFIVAPPIPLIDDSPGNVGGILRLESGLGGPGVASGAFGDPAVSAGGVGFGGANNIAAAADFNSDGSLDLVVTGTKIVNGTNFRSSIFLVGNETANGFRVTRPQRSIEYGGSDPSTAGADSFIGCAAINSLADGLTNVLHVSLNGRLWLDSNAAVVLNRAPIATIRREDLRSPFGSGRKLIITAGQSAAIPVLGFDPDGDRLSFRLATSPDGQPPPSFITLTDGGLNSATATIDSSDINRGPGDLIFRIAVEAGDGAAGNAGERQPLTGRDYFTLVVKPNTPPTIGAIANQTVEANKTVMLQLSLSDKESANVTTSTKCDRGNFVGTDGAVLTIAPKTSDVGTIVCAATAEDEFGLSATVAFTVTVLPSNQAPTIAPIADQSVKIGDVRMVPISGSDPDGAAGLTFSIVSAPAFITLSDNGSGTGTIRIAPTPADAQGGRVTIRITDPTGLFGQTSFNANVQTTVVIASALYDKPSLVITGFGFGSSGAKVSVNGKDVSSAVRSQSDGSIILKGTMKKLNLKRGPNQIVVNAGGIASSAFVLTL